MSVSKTISEENSFSNSILIGADHFSISIQGTFVATVTLQKTYNEVDWLDVQTFTLSGEFFGLEPEGSKYRIGVKTGDFTSGSVNVRLGA